MLEFSPLEPENYYRRSFEQAVHFIKGQGAQDTEFLIAPVESSLPNGTVISLRYSSEKYADGNYLATVSVQTLRGPAAFQSGLRDSLLFLECVFGDPETRQALRKLDPTSSVTATASRLGLSDDLEHPNVSSFDDYYRIDAVSQGFGLSFVERGLATALADSPLASLLAFVVYVSKRQMQTNVAERSANAYRALLESGFEAG